jgi:hypothetical protein
MLACIYTVAIWTAAISFIPVDLQPIRIRQKRFAALMSTLCIVLLFGASLIEATHFCESGPSGRSRQLASQTSHPNASGICELCATSHQASIPTGTCVAVSLCAVESVPLVPAQTFSRQQSFTMDVRPPPSVSL